jgi:4-amino-4-deoxy-L-arabinose transferase-like glycosyltransferase
MKKNKIELSLVFSIFLLGFFFYLWIFLRNKFLPMIDGPYYLIQVRSLLSTGELVYGDPPLIFYLLSFFSLLLGDITLGVKVGVSLFCALSTIPVFFLMKRVGKGTMAGIISMLLVIFSAPYIRMITDFMKNAVGITFLFAFIYYLHDLAFSGLKKRSLILASFFVILTGLTHILDFGVALLFLALYTIIATIVNVNRRPFLKAAGIIALITCIFVFIASTFFSFLFTDFNKGLSFLNALILQRVMGAPTQPSSNLGLYPRSKPFGPNIPFSVSIVGGWGVILLILSFGVILSIYLWKKKEKEPLLLLTVATSIGAIICFPLIPNNWLGRFVLMMVIPTAIILSYGISKIYNLIKKSKFDVSLFFVVICLAFFVIQSITITGSIRPTIGNTGFNDLVNMKSHIPTDSIIVVFEQGLYYWVQYVGEVDIGRLSPDLWQSYSHVLGLSVKDRTPQIPFKTIFVGNIFKLVELQQNLE